ncbi:hypothetical protein [Streptomyces albidoflavus]|uniref:hypothetical protein n=1 Tax=Streptomyces albidoflavus TaxID=1886 RepID=UPI0033C5D415
MVAVDGGEVVMEAVGESVQTAVVAVKLMLAVSKAVREQVARAEAARAAAEGDAAAAEQAAGESLAAEEAAVSDADLQAAAEAVKRSFPADVASAVLRDGRWREMAVQIATLSAAGVDLGVLMPHLGEVATSVRDAVASKAEADGWGQVLREAMPAGLVREAILTSPAWPEIATQMSVLQQRGVDVRAVLVRAHEEGVGVDQAVSRLTAPSPRPGEDWARRRWYGPLTEGLSVPADLDLGNRRRAFAQLGITAEEHADVVQRMRRVWPSDHQVAAVVKSPQWPLLAARMVHLGYEGADVEARLKAAPLPPGESGVEELVRHTHVALTGRRTGGVSSAAARATSVTVSEKAVAAAGGAAKESALKVHLPAQGPAVAGRAARGR